tara:strand:- start:129 stop:935 length:807 start_codon:yes stop_codon:yes gene_type:complete
MQSFQKYTEEIYESLNAKGLAYELEVFTAMKNANIKDLNVGDIPGRGFSNQGAGDIEATYKGKEFNIEIKLDKNAQMGGTSIRIDTANNTHTLVKPDAVEDDAIPFFIEAARKQDKPLKDWVNFIRKQEPVDFHKKIPYTIPFGSVTRDAWGAAQKAGYLANMNAIQSFDSAKTIAKAYNRKNVYYIQIGKAGLFYLGSNPLKLPIPQFNGTINIEFRLGPSGSKKRKWNDETLRVVGAGYRCQGRFKTNLKSKYSLDDPKSIQKLFG